MKPQTIPQTHGHQSNDEALTLFRRIITNQVQPYVGSHGAQTSPAIVVGLVTAKGEVVEAFGTREINKNLPPDGDTLFGIGSISKLFTGLILAKVVANGDIRLSDKANKYLEPSIQIDHAITLKQLVTHFSGLSNFPGNIATPDNDDEDMKPNALMPAKNYSKNDLAKCLATHNCRPLNPPGKRYLYSNLGIGLLSIALQNQSGFSDFNSMNQANITQAIQMNDTSTNITDFLEKHKRNYAQGYMARNQSLMPVPFSEMGILAGSGELISTANDMNKLLKSLTGLSTNALAPAVKEAECELAEVEPGIKISYAQEIRLASDGGKIHYKSGLTAGYSAIMLWRDNPKVGLIILANRGKFRPLLSTSNRLFEIITRQLQAMP